MRRVAKQKRSLAAELENLLDAYQWARLKIYRKYGVGIVAIGLLRRAAFFGGISLADFRRITDVPKYALTRASHFLTHPKPNNPDLAWARVSPIGKKVQVIPTPEGTAFLKELDRATTREFFRGIRVEAGTKEAKDFAEALGDLNAHLPKLVEGQFALLSSGKFGKVPW